ncbi:MAG: tyrosine-type recombinase/integrase, partial [Nitrospirae bacterium]|nr:tyrosine-type recombinase/integrase [Nitrospirota bacterium]
SLGLRCGDLRELTWEDLEGDKIKLIEGKTRKFRVLTVHPELKAISDRNREGRTGPIFVGQKKNILTIQRINSILHRIATEYGISGSFTSHSLRKTMGRRIWERDNQSERSLIYLSKLFNHSSTEITRIYLGITSDEIADLYMSL